MSSPNYALAFGRVFWLKSAREIIALTVSTLVFCSVRVVPTQFSDLVYITTTLIWVATLLGFLIQHCDLRTSVLGESSLPRHFLLLPIGDSGLTLWLVALPTVFLAAIGAAAGWACMIPENMRVSHWILAVSLPTMFIVMRAASWTTFRLKAAAVVWGLLIVLVLVLGFTAGNGSIEPNIYAAECLGTSLFFIAYTCGSVHRTRRGLIESLRLEFRYRAKERLTFATSGKAQEWIERTLNMRNTLVIGTTYTLTVLAVCLVSPSTHSVSVGVSTNATVHLLDSLSRVPDITINTTSMCLAVLLVCLPYVVSLAGCCSPADQNTRPDGTMNPHLALRPLSSLELLSAKVQAGLRSIGIASLIGGVTALAVLCLPVLGQDRLPIQTLLSVVGPTQALAYAALFLWIFAFAFKQLVSGIWISLGHFDTSVRSILQVITAIPWILGTYYVIALNSEHNSLHELGETGVLFALWSIWLVKVVGIYLMLRSLPQTQEDNRGPVLIWLIGCAILWVLLTRGMWLLLPHSFVNTAFGATLAFYMLPIVRPGLALICLDRNRHA